MQLDPITFEVLRHRLWSINEEAGATLRNVSGSSVVTEINDFNTALMGPQGDEVIIGSYMLVLGTPGQIAKRVLADYAENPGISLDDIFLCSDPYSGAIHQNDVTLVVPIHWESRLIAWCSSTLHYVDVGGSEAGSQASITATSIYEEPIPIPPLKIVERGNLRRDLEREFLVRSRTPELNALDLRAQIAAANGVKARVHGLIARYGVQTFEAFLARFVDVVESRFRNRLRELPDGRWSHTQFLDVNRGEQDEVYTIKLRMTKEGDRLIFDFRGSSRQALALINTTPVGARAAVLASLLINLCYHEIPWCPAGVLSRVDIVTEKGTIVDAEWPAGCCKATTSILPMVNTAAHVCLAKMLAASQEYRNRVMAPWYAVSGAEELFGTDQTGKAFGVTLLDTLAGGGGARSLKDGIDVSGTSRSLSVGLSNVETYESRYPVLYLHRRLLKDSGGAGRFRGGVGISAQYIPWDTDLLPTKIAHACGVTHPATPGLFGGLPGGSNVFLMKRATDIEDRLRNRIPSGLDDLQGVLEVLPGLAKTYQRRGDVYQLVTGGGGGYGDPLSRDPARVLEDVLGGLVSEEAALRFYGVVITSERKVDWAVTEEKRKTLRDERRRRAARAGNSPGLPGENQDFACQNCDRRFAGEGSRDVLCYETGLGEAGPWVNPYQLGSGRFFLRWYVCPGCFSLLDIQVDLLAN